MWGEIDLWNINKRYNLLFFFINHVRLLSHVYRYTTESWTPLRFHPKHHVQNFDSSNIGSLSHSQQPSLINHLSTHPIYQIPILRLEIQIPRPHIFIFFLLFKWYCSSICSVLTWSSPFSPCFSRSSISQSKMKRMRLSFIYFPVEWISFCLIKLWLIVVDYSDLFDFN